MLYASEVWRNGRHQSRANSGHGDYFASGSSSGLNLQFQYRHKSMATQIRYPRLIRWCKLGTTDLRAIRKDYILRGARSFSSTRIFAQDTATAPTHGFSNGQNLGSITLKKNGVYLENKLRIVRGVNDRFTNVRLIQ